MRRERDKARRRGVEILKNAGIKPGKLMFYMLCGYFNTTHEQNMHRFEVLRELGVDPYVMVYNNINRRIPNNSKKRTLKDFKRWVNGRIYKVDPWEKYDPLHSFKKWRSERKADAGGRRVLI